MKQDVAAVIIAYNPPESFSENLLEISRQVDAVLVIDNASEEKYTDILEQVAQRPKISVIYNNENMGVATALNQGFGWATQRGFGYVLTFDQDSSPSSGMVQKLLDVYQLSSEASTIAIVAPRVIDSAVGVASRYLRPKGRFFFELVACEYGFLDDVVFVITSGSLCNLRVYQTIGGFEDDFFIDYVDVEYCLHARSLGYNIIVACDAVLSHSLGAREERSFLGKKEYPRFHSPLRWYYQSRNRILVLKKYLSQNFFLFFYEGMNVIYGVTRMLAFENDRLKKVRAIVLGSFQAIRKKTSVLPFEK